VLQIWTRATHPTEIGRTEDVALNAVLLATEFESVSHRKIMSNVQQQRVLFASMLEMQGSNANDVKTDSKLLEPLTHLWREYLARGRDRLQELGERVLISAEIVPGFATADLVVGLTLVEIKTYADPSPHLDAWLDQLLGYLLLDRWNTLKITGLALYCGWQARTLTVTVEELLKTSAREAPVALHDLRALLREAMRDDLDDAEQRYQQRRFPVPPEAIAPQA